MLPRAHRITKQKDFDILFRKAKSFQGKELVVRVRDRGEGKVRVGVIVSKKSAKKATARNRLKRRIRETLPLFIPLFPKGTDIVVITRPGAETVDEKQILSTLRTLLEKAIKSIPNV